MASTETLRNALFATIVDNQAVVLSGIREQTRIIFHGTTIQASTAPNASGELPDSLTFYPKRGERGIIAVVVKAFSHWVSGKHPGPEFVKLPAFLQISWENGEEKPHIDLDHPWYPSDRIGQVTEDHVEVTIGGKRFASHDHKHWSFNDRKNNPVYVPDGNLLCRYLFGTASAAEVLHAAVQGKVEPLAQQRVEQLTNRVQCLEYENKSLENSRDVARAGEDAKIEQIVLLCGKVEQLAASVSCLKSENANLKLSHALTHEGMDRVAARLIESENRLGSYEKAVSILKESDSFYKMIRRIPAWLRTKSISNFIEAMENMPEHRVTA